MRPLRHVTTALILSHVALVAVGTAEAARPARRPPPPFELPTPLPPGTRLSHGRLVPANGHLFVVESTPGKKGSGVRVLHTASAAMLGRLTCTGGAADDTCRAEVFDHAARCLNTSGGCQMLYTPTPTPAGR
jgi:hypothetical protein